MPRWLYYTNLYTSLSRIFIIFNMILYWLGQEMALCQSILDTSCCVVHHFSIMSYPILSFWYHSVSDRIKSYYTIVSNHFMQYHKTRRSIILSVYLYVWRQTPPQSNALILQCSVRPSVARICCAHEWNLRLPQSSRSSADHGRPVALKPGMYALAQTFR